MKGIRVSHPAERDLDGIWYYTAKKSGSMEVGGVSFSLRRANRYRHEFRKSGEIRASPGLRSGGRKP